MLKIVTAFIALLAGTWVLAGSATSASAHYHHAGCCGPTPPTYIYHTVHREKHVTRYHDVSLYKHVTRIHRIVHITRIQPIVHIHSVTRYHHHTIVSVRPSYEHRSEYLPAHVYVTHSSSNSYDCRCVGYHRHPCR